MLYRFRTELIQALFRSRAEQIINQRAFIVNQEQTMNMIDSNVSATHYFAEEAYHKWN